MGECLLIGKGTRGGEEIGIERTFRTEIITENTIWTPPAKVKDNKFYVRLFGGGGFVGGGGGYMNYGEITVPYGETFWINIGAAGAAGAVDGGTTTFGNYLSAAGGTSAKIVGIDSYGGNGGSGGSGDFYSQSYDHMNIIVHGGRGFQFGGGGARASSTNNFIAVQRVLGGDGGIWGGGGSSIVYTRRRATNTYGGNGGTYGGGGGGMEYGGNGGTYGGGGGIDPKYGEVGGRGGTYGGNGGNWSAPAQNGTNTSTWTNVDMIPGSLEDFIANTNYVYLRGWGRAGSDTNGNSCYFGGGGFGGNGGSGYGGGGGGYGGDGGSYNGGGGGYGGNGGNTGGGGGYGPGADGIGLGGGGFYTASDGDGGAAYGSYGRGGNRNATGATSGVCIIQYWAP